MKKVKKIDYNMNIKTFITLLSVVTLGCNNNTNGQLSFQQDKQTLGFTGRCCASGDIDNDGDIDIVIGCLKTPMDIRSNKTNVTDTNYLWINNGKGSFTRSQQFLGKNANHVKLTDLNGDNRLDIVFAIGGGIAANPEEAVNAIWINTGHCKFKRSGQSIGYNSEYVQIIDFNNDAEPDISIADTIWLNDGKGNFRNSSYFISENKIKNFTLGDLDNDNDMDAFGAGFDFRNGSPCKVFFNDGKEKFILDQNQKISSSQTIRILLGDLNGDDFLDAFLINGHDAAGNKRMDEIWLNQGNGNFINGNFNNLQKVTFSAEMIDIDRDGDLDIYTAYFKNESSEMQYIWLNDGKGKFTDSGVRIPGYIGGVSINDFNGDGKLDLLVLDYHIPVFRYMDCFWHFL